MEFLLCEGVKFSLSSHGQHIQLLALATQIWRIRLVKEQVTAIAVWIVISDTKATPWNFSKCLGSNCWKKTSWSQTARNPVKRRENDFFIFQPPIIISTSYLHSSTQRLWSHTHSRRPQWSQWVGETTHAPFLATRLAPLSRWLDSPAAVCVHALLTSQQQINSLKFFQVFGVKLLEKNKLVSNGQKSRETARKWFFHFSTSYHHFNLLSSLLHPAAVIPHTFPPAAVIPVSRRDNTRSVPGHSTSPAQPMARLPGRCVCARTAHKPTTDHYI